MIEYDLDGVYELSSKDFDAMDAMDDGSAASWLVTLTTALRAKLPEGQCIINHAPIAPWYVHRPRNGHWLAEMAKGFPYIT